MSLALQRIACLLSLVAQCITYGYEVVIDYDSGDAALCPEDKVIPTANVPFSSKEDVQDWLNVNQMCYFAFVNEAAEYPAILSEVADARSKVCWDQDCEDPLSDLIVQDINTLRDYVDIHRQEYTVTDFSKYSFRVEGTRYVKIEDGMSVPGFMNDVEIENEFEEEYTFNPSTGTLKKRNILTSGSLAGKLLQAGLIKYAHFARSVGQRFDIPERFNLYKYSEGDNVYSIPLNNIVVISILLVVAVFTLCSFCWTCRMMMQCLNEKRTVHHYADVRRGKPVDMDSADD